MPMSFVDDGSTPEDYCLIARIRNSPTGGLLIVSAGIKQFGTEAAGRLLAEPTEFSAILSKLPPRLGEKEHAAGAPRQSHRQHPRPAGTRRLPRLVKSRMWGRLATRLLRQLAPQTERSIVVRTKKVVHTKKHPVP